jgi:hypothetical protein
MLQPAHIGHLAMLRSLIRQGAQDGNFDPELGESSPQAEAFFAKLKRALVTGYFVEERGGKIDTVSVPGYVYWPDDRNTGTQPVGFGLFRAISSGYELWLAGLDLSARGGGHGRSLLAALFAPQGQNPNVRSCNQRHSEHLPPTLACPRAIRRACAGSCGLVPRPTWYRLRDAVAASLN